MSDFAVRLIRWQRTHGRHDLPWQGADGMTRCAQASGAGVPSPRLLPQTAGSASNVSEADAYHVWLSEVMLQQTQVATVIPYYRRFVASFPNIASLAAASEEQVLTHWSGLGYYARGRNLHKAAQFIVERFNGEFPRKIEDILELPGIGRSTAAAICALAFHERRAILDGNVKRVLARYCGIAGWAGDKKIEERLWQHAENLLPPPCRGRVGEGVEIMPTSTPILAFPLKGGRDVSAANEQTGINNDIATYTQALMDLGATVCTRSKPECGECPVQAGCIAFNTGRVNELPTPRPRKAVPERHAVFLLLMRDNDILLEKRPGSGIWGGLWCPPQFDDEAAAKDWFLRSGMTASEGERLEAFTHTFTHFRLHITPLKIRLSHKPLRAAQPGSVWLDVEEALRAAIPTPVRKVLENLGRSW
ncbi:MAG TPA: A/G-specific adenine glycosylase [Gallionella sp.]|nr:A/G-specific adenine glycosylase [Gallionella sp.]